MRSEGFLDPRGRHLRGSAFVPLALTLALLFGGSACPSGAGPAVVPEDGGTAADITAADRPATPDDADDARAEASADVPADLPPPPAPYARPDYQSLFETGLYADPTVRLVSGDLMAFAPTHELWSDGAEKRRWLSLPPGTQIDTSQMDHWSFPVGTKLWKEFSQGGVLLETRLIERYGTGPEDYWMGAFVWNADQSDARFAVDGQADINGTHHDAPAQKNCGACHRGEPGRVLGFSAIQLSRDGDGPTLKELAAARLLSHPPAGAADYPVPGDARTVAALGYLHANCGHCHNMNGTSWPDTQVVMRLRVSERDPATSELYTSMVGKKLQYWRGGAITLRVSPGDPAASAVTTRMFIRGSKDQMPPLATEVVDDLGFTLVRDWIAALPH